jgi:hypothetical protein
MNCVTTTADPHDRHAPSHVDVGRATRRASDRARLPPDSSAIGSHFRSSPTIVSDSYRRIRLLQLNIAMIAILPSLAAGFTMATTTYGFEIDAEAHSTDNSRNSTGIQRPRSPVTSARVVETGMSAQRLRCEYLEDPIGIDHRRPRLSWKLKATARGRRQSAYLTSSGGAELTAAAELLTAGRGGRPGGRFARL